jgi:hypothetical protein
MAAINYGLQEAVDNLEVPRSTLGKRLKTKVRRSYSMLDAAYPAANRPDVKAHPSP